MKLHLSFVFVAVLFWNVSLQAEELVVTYESPNRVLEVCHALPEIPGGDYSKKDIKKESKYCNTSFYSEAVALCPKTWSTSPGTMVRGLLESEFDKSSYMESSFCGDRRKKKGLGVKNIAKFKNSMNQSGTSATLSQASLMYYHFSRYFDTKVKVPVAVYREIDRKYHLDNVATRALQKTTKGRIGKAWAWMKKVLLKPEVYRPVEDLFTEDLEKIYGVMLKGKGARYGEEFNGLRTRGWGTPQHKQLMDTAAFKALKDEDSLSESIQNGIDSAKRTGSVMRKQLGEVSDLQMVYWMREISEISLMDFIFAQQDRVGNIDYVWEWVYVKDGQVKSQTEKRDEFEELSRTRMHKITPPVELASYNPVLIQRTQLNDNDAAIGLTAVGKYVNQADKAGWLKGVKHYSSKIYNKLLELDSDLQSQGPIFEWISKNANLNKKRMDRIINNVNRAAKMMREQCTEIRFDLDDVDDFLLEGFREESVDCAAL